MRGSRLALRAAACAALTLVAGDSCAYSRKSGVCPCRLESRDWCAESYRDPQCHAVCLRGEPKLGDRWWERMLSRDTKRCGHTYGLTHWAMPHQQCREKARVGRCRDGAKWLCGLSGPLSRDGCVIYSFGSSNDSCFESAARQLTRCEIHIFDPTSPELRHKGWTYHSYGIAGRDKSDTSYWSWDTQKRAFCKGCRTKTLREAMSSLGHEWVDVLKVDVDGAEWRAFSAAFADFGTSLPFGQVQVELTGLDITPESGGKRHEFFDGMFSRGFSLFHVESQLATCPRRAIGAGVRGADQAPSVEYAFINTKSPARRAPPPAASSDGKSRRAR